MAWKKLTNESLWNTEQLRGTIKDELYWAVEALKGVSGKENTDEHSIFAIADWFICYNRVGRVDLPFAIEGLLFRPGMPPANVNENDTYVEGTCLIIGHRVKKGGEA